MKEDVFHQVIFTSGKLWSNEAVVQEVRDVKLLIVKKYGKAVYADVAAFYGDGVLPPGEAGFGLSGYITAPVLSSVVL
jgi:hypothetical protein